MKYIPRLTAFLCLLVSSPAFSQQSQPTIHDSRVDGELVRIYHDPFGAKVAEKEKWTAKVEGISCLIDTVHEDKRGGDAVTVMIVIDRGGKPNKALSQHTPAFASAIKASAARAIRNDEHMHFMICDTYGPNPVRCSERTRDQNIINNWVDDFPTETNDGANIYGSGLLALGKLRRESKDPLRTMLLISDGIDPDEALGRPRKLVDAAKEEGVIVSVIWVDRKVEGDLKVETNKSHRKKYNDGRNFLTEVQEGTDGDFHTIKADKETIRGQLEQKLDEMANGLTLLKRSSCALCGEFVQKKPAIVEFSMTTENNETISTLRSAKPDTVKIPTKKYVECEEKVGIDCEEESDCGGCLACVSGTCKVQECETSDECPSGCSCIDGECTVQKCETDEDCPEGFACMEGACQAQAEDALPVWAFVAAGAAALLLLILLFVVQSKKKRAEAEQRRIREEAARSEQEAEDRLQREQDRRAAQEQQAQMDALRHQQETQRKDAEIERTRREAWETANPIILRLISADGSGAVDFEMRAGEHTVGADDTNALVLDHATVSGQHFKIVIDRNEAAFITDLGSSNGTFVNGYQIQPSTPTELRPGDVLGVSRSYELRLAPPVLADDE